MNHNFINEYYMKGIIFILLSFFGAVGLSGQSYYWVGGSGNWSDITHWATSSGGTVFHNQVPTSDDDVIFDQNSFTAPNQVVTVNNPINFCKSILFEDTNSPTFVLGMGNTLNVFGSFIIDPTVSLQFEGQLVLQSELAGSVLHLQGKTGVSNLEIDAAGEYLFQSDIFIEEEFEFTRGTLLTNDFDLRCNYFRSFIDNPRALDLGNSTITINGETQVNTVTSRTIPSLLINTNQLSFDAGTSVMNINSPLSYAWLTGNEAIRFNEVNVESTAGISEWGFYHPQNTTYLNPPPLSVSKLNLVSSTHLFNNESIDSLILVAGQQYTLEENTNTTVNYLEAEGTCTEIISLSSFGASEAIINTDEALEASFLSVSDIHISGSGTITASSSVDGGNLVGWDLNQKVSETLYWIGGTGNWSNPANWSYTSGGAPASCIPTSVDDVVFDQNSFSANNQSVDIDLAVVYCRTMDWRDIDVLASMVGPEDHLVEISGSLFFAPTMSLDFEGDFNFNSSSTNTILSNGQKFNRNIFFSGVQASWTLLDYLDVDNEIHLLSGSFITDGHNMNCNRFFSESGIQRTLDIRNSYVTFTSNPVELLAPQLILSSNGMETRAANSTIELFSNNDGRIRLYGDAPLELNVVISSCANISTFGVSNADKTIFIDSLIYNFSNTFMSETKANTIIFSPGTEQIFNGGSVDAVRIIANGDCASGMIYMEPSIYVNSYTIKVEEDVTFSKVYIEGASNIGQGQINVENGTDGGGNTAVNFLAASGSDLYWVNGPGDWYDRDHWSYTSGGPGGACVPTLIDNVNIDENSFPSGNAGTITDLNRFEAFCDTLRISDQLVGNLRLSVQTVNVAGNIEVDREVNLSLASFIIKSAKTKSIKTSGSLMRSFSSTSQDTIYQLDQLNVSGGFFHHSGFYFSQGNEITAAFIEQRNRYESSEVWLGSSSVLLRNTFGSVAPFLTQYDDGILNGEQSVIELQDANSSVTNRLGILNLNKVIFSSLTGTSFIRNNRSPNTFAKYVQFNANGTISADIVVDSLIFAPGGVYTIDFQKDITLNDFWLTRGNNCLPIELRSSDNTRNATIEVADEIDIIADFIQMENITLQGSKQYPAGFGSTDINNSNEGWIFNSGPAPGQEIGFLGPDRYLCGNRAVTLSANNYNPNETYIWSTGSLESEINVDREGTYWAEVTFANGCIIRDTINVIEADDFEVDLGGDRALCDGAEEIITNLAAAVPGITYTWNDGSMEDTLRISQEGIYWLEGSIGDCMDRDTVEIMTVPRPSVSLGKDTVACGADSIQLSAQSAASNILWSNGDMGTTSTIFNSGQYIVEVYEQPGCSNFDTINVQFVDIGDEIFRDDTTLCFEDSYLLEGLSNADTYLWSTGSTNSAIIANSSGVYWLEMTFSGCSLQDTIELTFLNLEDDPIVRDSLSQCKGDSVFLSLSAGSAQYFWSNGSQADSFYSQTTGLYSVLLDYGACQVRDSFYWSINQTPVLEDLGDNQSTCEGDSIRLSANVDIGTISWDDGTDTDSRIITNSGIYIAIADHQGCTISDTIELTFRPRPESDLEDEYSFCSGDTARIVSVSQTDSILFSNGDLGDFITTQPGTYFATFYQDGCTTEDSFKVTFIDPPLIDLGSDTVICKNTLLNIELKQEAVWQDGETTSMYSIGEAGVYWAQISEQGCTSTDTLIVEVRAEPNTGLEDTYQECEGTPLTLSLPDELQNIEWYDGASSYTKIINEQGVYTLQYSDSFNCSYQDTFSFDWNPVPFIDLGPDFTICRDEEYQVDANTDADLVSWQGAAPISDLTYTTRNEEQIVAVANIGACTSADTLFIELRDCPSFEMYIPNIFSPNSDGINDVFEISYSDISLITSYELQIFDRWGSLLFESRDPAVHWDGRSKGQEVRRGVYVYSLQIQTRDSKRPITRKGSLTIP